MVKETGARDGIKAKTGERQDMTIRVGRGIVRFRRWHMAALSLMAMSGAVGVSHAQTAEPAPPPPPPSARSTAPARNVLAPPPAGTSALLSQVPPGTQAPLLVAPSTVDTELPLKPPPPGATPPPLLVTPVTPRQ